MKILLSIRPKWCKLIADGKKTLEVRKTKPRCPLPFKAFIYESKSTDKSRLGNGWTVDVITHILKFIN